ncbi:T9SS type A sorting domain-containing protein [Hyphobacterium sp. CCMP332]|nr:T9SS type A sorting domain-containing protein [Hyphobacterium sp. CCMP332]
MNAIQFDPKQLLIIMLLVKIIFFPDIVLAQNVNSFCGTDQVDQILRQQFPEMNKKSKEQESFIKHFTETRLGQKTQAQYVIPVVVHVMHNYGAENLPDANIHDMLRIVNEDFQGLQPDTGAVAAQFKPIIGGLDIEFRLATKDPNGNCTNGINRVHDPVYTYQGGYVNSNYIGFPPIQWPRNQYLNIWVVNDIDVPNGFLGYSSFPDWPAGRDGVVIEYTVFGSLPPSSTNNFNARYMSHEIGHSLNLFHTWGNGGPNGDPGNCAFDDLVGDTPNTIGNNDCINLSSMSCGSIDNNQNLMDYGYGNCAGGLMFTAGQMLRAEATLNSSVGGRNNLWTQTNLIATGTDSATYANLPVCIPIADFRAPIRLGCEGVVLSFRDESYNATYDQNTWTYNWVFEGGNPVNSSDRNPIVSYDSAGDFDVSLTVSNQSGSSQVLTRTDHITITPGSGSYVGPYLEQLDDQNWPSAIDPSLIWSTAKPSGSLFQFQRSSNAYYSSPASLYLNNFSFNSSGEFDLITPLADLTQMQAGNAFLNFQVAHAQKSNELENILLWVSTDCGLTFNFVKAWNANIINTVATTNTAFIPTDTSEWNFVSYDISNYAGMDNVQFMFRFNANSGNNLWLDDIHISDSDQPVPLTTGFRKDLFGEFNLYPNPNSGSFTIQFYLNGNEKASAEIIDIIGQPIHIDLSKTIQSGWNTVRVNSKDFNLKPGIHFLKLTSGDNTYSKRFIIK